MSDEYNILFCQFYFYQKNILHGKVLAEYINFPLKKIDNNDN